MTFSREELQRQLLETFKAELEQHAETLENGLLEIEAAEGRAEPGTVAEMFRAAHSLKGAARMVELDEISRLAHAMEDVLGAIRDQGPAVEVGRAVIDALLAGTDGLRRAMVAFESGERLGDQELEVLSEALRGAVQALGAAGTPSVPETAGEPSFPPGPAAAPPGEPRPERLAPAPQHPARRAGAGSPGSGLIRVGPEKIDALIAQVGELLTIEQGHAMRSRELEGMERRLAELARRLARGNGGRSGGNGPAAGVQDLAASFSRLVRAHSAAARAAMLRVREIQDLVHDLRMVPLSLLLNRLPRIARDAARSSDKQVRLELQGEDLRIDRAVLEQLHDPLLHLVRNAVDHGIEDPGTRRTAGKPAAGRVSVTARRRGAVIEIEIGDDGAGIPLSRLVDRAVARGVLDAERARKLSDEERLELLYVSGVSSAASVTEISGRGVGMDVVRQTITALHGRIEVDTAPGKGTTFRLTIPVSLATTLVLTVRIGGTRVGIPVGVVERLLRLQDGDIRRVEGQPVVAVDGRPVPLYDLGILAGLGKSSRPAGEGRSRVAVCSLAGRRVALLVEETSETREVVLRETGRQLAGARALAGAAILPDGGVLPVLDLGVLVERAEAGTYGAVAPEPAARPRRVLLADDSMTTRTLEKSILEGAGYRVTAVGDGREALEVLRSEPFDAVVSDVHMPGLSGLELTSKLRSDPDTRHLPVVLVTSLGSDEDRARGLEAGADAYLVKKTFDQAELLAALDGLIGEAP